MDYFISKNMIIHVEDCYWGTNASYCYNIMENIKKGATLCKHCKHKYHYIINLEKSFIFLKEKELKYWLVDDQLFFRASKSVWCTNLNTLELWHNHGLEGHDQFSGGYHFQRQYEKIENVISYSMDHDYYCERKPRKVDKIAHKLNIIHNKKVSLYNHRFLEKLMQEGNL